MRNLLCSLMTLAAMALVPMAAHAVIPAEEMNMICSAGSPVCRAYVLGGSERYWLLHSEHDTCVEETDVKALDTLMEAAVGKENPFAGKAKDYPAVFALLQYLTTKKLEMCSLGMKFSELLGQCDSKDEKDQNLCNAYIGGVLDMALAFNDIQQKKSGEKELKPLFCESMTPVTAKTTMNEKEILAAIADWRKARPDRPKKTPAAQEVINALVMKYPCSKDNILSLEKKKK